MDRMLVLLIVVALIAVGVVGVRWIARKIRSTKTRSVQSAAHSRKLRWVAYVVISLISLALIAPIFIASGVVNSTAQQQTDRTNANPKVLPTPQPTIRIASAPTAAPQADYATATPTGAADRVVVSCGFNGDDAQLAKALREKNGHQLDLITTGCHIPANGPLASCTFMKSQDPSLKPQTTPRECLARAPPSATHLGIVDEFGDFQVEEWVHVSLNGKPVGVIHLYEGKPAEVLLIAAPKAGGYTYDVQVETHYDVQGDKFVKNRTGHGAIVVRNED